MVSKELEAIRKKLNHIAIKWSPSLWLDTKIPGLNEVVGHQKRGMSFGRLIEIYGWECLAGDTLIDTPRDLNKYPKGIPIKDLVGKMPWVYGFDQKQGRIVLRQASRVWRVGKRPVYKVTFDVPRNSVRKFGRQPEYILATESHPFMLRNAPFKGLKVKGSDYQRAISSYDWESEGYRCLKDLKPGDRLMPMFRKMVGGSQKHSVIHLNNGESQLEHRFILSEIYGERSGDVWDGHHIDEAPLNHSVENLEWKTVSAHMSDHLRNRNLTKRSGWQKTGVHPRGMTGKSHTSKTRKEMSKASKAVWARRQAQALNHKVKNVEFYGYEDVYDMTVPGLDNFVANGVVVHNSQGKSSIIYSLAAMAQRDGAFVILGDIENSFESDWGRKRGLQACPACKKKPKDYNCSHCGGDRLDYSKLLVVSPYVGTFSEINPKTGKKRVVTRLTTAQELCSEVEEAIKLKRPQDKTVVILDSITAMLTAGESEAGVTGGNFKSDMALPKFIGRLCRRWIGLAQTNNALIILVNQLRTGPEGEYTPGGNAPKFYSHVRLRVQRVKGSRIKDGGKTIGIRGKIQCIKNKTGGVEDSDIGFRLYFNGPIEFLPVKDLSDDD